jgi:hypothetical protein
MERGTISAIIEEWRSVAPSLHGYGLLPLKISRLVGAVQTGRASSHVDFAIKSIKSQAVSVFGENWQTTGEPEDEVQRNSVKGVVAQAEHYLSTLTAA